MFYTINLSDWAFKSRNRFKRSLRIHNTNVFSTTIDGYYISVKNRIVLTGNFDATTIPGVETAPFFANGDDARTKGLDVVLSYKTRFDENLISATFTGNFNDMEITDVKWSFG